MQGEKGKGMVPWAGVEPATFRLGGERSIQLSYQGGSGDPTKAGHRHQMRPDGAGEAGDAGGAA